MSAPVVEVKFRHAGKDMIVSGRDPQLLLTPQGALAVAWALIEEARLTGLPSPSPSLMTESEHWAPTHRRGEIPAAPARQESEPGPLLQAMQQEPANDGAGGKKRAGASST